MKCAKIWIFQIITLGSKEKLGGWSETVLLHSGLIRRATAWECCILSPLVERIGELQDKKVDDQARILEQQHNPIVRKDKEVKVVHVTNDALIVAKSYSAALAPNKIEAAVKISFR